jgi:cation diffusion facilitator family transporter
MHDSHSHTHTHSHYHLHSHEQSTRMVVLISVGAMCLELYYGYAAHSMALIMDGWHMLSHVLVLSLAWAAYAYLRTRASGSDAQTGERALSLSAFASAVILLVITGVIIWESIDKFRHADMVASNEALLVAVIGLVINGVSAYFLHREEEHADLNLHAAYLHVLSDVVLSAFAIISIAACRFWGVQVLDPICGIIGALIIMRWAVGLVRRSWIELLNPDPQSK